MHILQYGVLQSLVVKVTHHPCVPGIKELLPRKSIVTSQ